MKYTLDSFGIIGFDIHFNTLQSKENDTGKMEEEGVVEVIEKE
jgi:hypothetical protein